MLLVVISLALGYYECLSSSLSKTPIPNKISKGPKFWSFSPPFLPPTCEWNSLVSSFSTTLLFVNGSTSWLLAIYMGRLALPRDALLTPALHSSPRLNEIHLHHRFIHPVDSDLFHLTLPSLWTLSEASKTSPSIISARGWWVVSIWCQLPHIIPITLLLLCRGRNASRDSQSSSLQVWRLAATVHVMSCAWCMICRLVWYVCSSVPIRRQSTFEVCSGASCRQPFVVREPFL